MIFLPLTSTYIIAFRFGNHGSVHNFLCKKSPKNIQMMLENGFQTLKMATTVRRTGTSHVVTVNIGRKHK
jgi:hypothetical protein